MDQLAKRKIIRILLKHEKIGSKKILQRHFPLQRWRIDQNSTIAPTEIKTSLWNLLAVPTNPQQPRSIRIPHIPNSLLAHADNNNNDGIINVRNNNLIIGSLNQLTSLDLLKIVPTPPLIKIIALHRG